MEEGVWLVYYNAKVNIISGRPLRREEPETDGNISIVSKRPIPRPLVSVSVSIEAVFESRYQSRYRSRGLCIFCMVLAEFLLSKVSVSVSVPVHFPGISISIGLDSDQL